MREFDLVWFNWTNLSAHLTWYYQGFIVIPITDYQAKTFKYFKCMLNYSKHKTTLNLDDHYKYTCWEGWEDREVIAHTEK
jgi:hypothetical protein